ADAPARQPGPCGAGSGDPGAAIPGGRGMRIAANLSLLFTERPLIERPRAACAAGFDAVEIQFPYEVPAVRLKEELERLQLPLVLINLPAGDLMQGGDGLACAPGFEAGEVQFPYGGPGVRLKEELERPQLPLVLINLPAGDLMQGGDGLACVPARQTGFDQALEEALSYAAMVRPQAVNVLAGRLPAGVAREQALATLITNLRRTAEAFQALGIRVYCEAINPLDMPGFLINTPEDLLGLLDAV